MNRFVLLFILSGAGVAVGVAGSLKPGEFYEGKTIRLTDGRTWVVLGRNPLQPDLWQITQDRAFSFSAYEDLLRAAESGEYPPYPGQ